MISQERSRRKPSGGRYRPFRPKKLINIGRQPAGTTIGVRRLQHLRVRGGLYKERLLRVEEANLLDPKSGKFERAKIKAVLENPANRNFVRMNIITKGAIISTERGKAKVTSRPGQDGVVNAILIE